MTSGSGQPLRPPDQADVVERGPDARFIARQDRDLSWWIYTKFAFKSAEVMSCPTAD